MNGILINSMAITTFINFNVWVLLYQSLHWLTPCYYMEITRHHCYTLPLCRLDDFSDSDECPELSADPATNQRWASIYVATVCLQK
jgi:hypothetical protein